MKTMISFQGAFQVDFSTSDAYLLNKMVESQITSHRLKHPNYKSQQPYHILFLNFKNIVS